MKRSLILMYHSIDNSGSAISVTPETFRWQMCTLADAGVEVAPLSEIHRRPGAVAITFDDGFRNVYEHAFPVLKDHGFPATVFAVTGYCGRRNDWPSQPARGIPLLELMSWGELKEIAEYGGEVGAHTVTHPRLTELVADRAEQEISASRETIEQRLGRRVTSFAYPYGDANRFLQALVESQFAVACSTRMRFCRPADNQKFLPRIDAYYVRSRFWFERLMGITGRTYVRARSCLRVARELLI